MIFDLPYPPTVNTYWRANGNRRFISAAGKKFREAAFKIIKAADVIQIEGDCRVDVDLYLPDRRKRDIDNILKPILDILQLAGVIKDDCQVQELTVARLGLEKGGRARVKIQKNATANAPEAK